MGSRKHFDCSYRTASHAENASLNMIEARKRLHKGALPIALAWIAFNSAVFIALSLPGLLTPPTMMIVVLAYAVSDLVCILFFCPFQSFFMRNRCCVVCRIYNWDYLMMCTPLIIFPSVYSVTLLLFSIAVVVQWEVALHKKTRLFMENTNENLRCTHCEDKMCLLKKHRGGR